MEYTIKKIAELSGVSTRTLRYYDEIGLLIPTRINTSGYRIYGTKELDQLQQILFYRSLDLKLNDIKQIITDPTFDSQNALRSHHQHLLEKRQQIDHLILTVEKTLRYQQGVETMTDQEKFEVFKKNKVKENDKQYGKEIREKYGKKEVERQNNIWENLTMEQYDEMENVEKELFSSLKIVLDTQDYSSLDAQNTFNMHKNWLKLNGSTYSKNFHLCLAEMYAADERFSEYYNSRVAEGAAETLIKIIQQYAA